VSDRLLQTAEGKFALIKGDEIIGVYDADAEAIREGHKRFGNVPFLAKRIVRMEHPMNFTARDLLKLPPEERRRRVADALQAAAGEDFETFEAYSEEDADA
jgi:hypothetical protein